jgi:hypothetical protein
MDHRPCPFRYSTRLQEGKQLKDLRIIDKTNRRRRVVYMRRADPWERGYYGKFVRRTPSATLVDWSLASSDAVPSPPGFIRRFQQKTFAAEPFPHTLSPLRHLPMLEVVGRIRSRLRAGF